MERDNAMRASFFALCLCGILLAASCPAGDATTVAPDTAAAAEAVPTPATITPGETVPTPEEAQAEPGNWERFKRGMKQAGDAVTSGAKSAAEKTGETVVRGAEKTGEFFSESYQDAKRYLHEKTEE